MRLLEFICGVCHIAAGASYGAVSLIKLTFDAYAILAIAMIGIGVCLIAGCFSKNRHHRDTE
jgi:hypothetical protein